MPSIGSVGMFPVRRHLDEFAAADEHHQLAHLVTVHVLHPREANRVQVHSLEHGEPDTR